MAQQQAIVAGGCFWCTEAVMKDVIGVSKVESGYIGGDKPDPTYKEVCTGNTGHAEGVRVTFDDRNGDSVTLRPEGTAGVARALISGGLSQHLPLRYYYEGPMFRYERPQKGRFRQFHQVGVELLGEPGPEADVEVIAVDESLAGFFAETLSSSIEQVPLPLAIPAVTRLCNWSILCRRS